VHCFGGTCIDGGADPEEMPGEVAWNYVGPGKGYYEKVQGFNFVGEGGGEWVKEDLAVPLGRQMRPQCRCFVALVAVAMGGGLGYLLWPYLSKAAWPSPPVRLSPEACAKEDASMTVELKHSCCKRYHLQCLIHDCDEGFSDWRREWSIPKKAWCCQQTLRGCPPPALVAPPGGPAPSHGPQPGRSSDPRFNCEIGFENFRAGWSLAKKQSCCASVGKGCPPQPGP